MDIIEVRTEEICPECGKFLTIEKRDLEFFTQLILKCECGYQFIFPPREKKVEISEEEKIEQPIKPVKRVRGISAKESRRLYRHTPAGKAAWERYRRSDLFYEAHARHRQTDKYKETQQRYKAKIKLFKQILDKLEGNSTCPLHLFWRENGRVMNNPDRCDYNPGVDNCNFGCIDI